MSKVEKEYAAALFEKNEPKLALLNNFVKENKIMNVSTKKICEELYYMNCAQKSHEMRHERMISWISFNDDIYKELMAKYQIKTSFQ
jgi:hypothetical protein